MNHPQPSLPNQNQMIGLNISFAAPTTDATNRNRIVTNVGSTVGASNQCLDQVSFPNVHVSSAAPSTTPATSTPIQSNQLDSITNEQSAIPGLSSHTIDKSHDNISSNSSPLNDQIKFVEIHDSTVNAGTINNPALLATARMNNSGSSLNQPSLSPADEMN